MGTRESVIRLTSLYMGVSQKVPFGGPCTNMDYSIYGVYMRVPVFREFTLYVYMFTITLLWDGGLAQDVIKLGLS